EPIPGIALEYDLVRKFADGITLEETSAAARELLLDTSRVVLATSPQREGLAIPTEAELRRVIADASAWPVTPWTETLSRTDLLTEKPQPGRITGSREIPAIGVTVLTLSNGAEVWLKPTDFQNDQVLLGAVAAGGAATARKEDYFETLLSPSLVGLAGIGGLTPPELSKLLAGRMAQVNAWVDLQSHGLRGTSRPQDLETALQLLYLTVTQPNTDQRGFDLMTRQLSALVANRENNPQAVFRDRLRALNSGDHYMTQPITADVVASLDRETMVDAFRSRFANAADFTFFIVGAFDPQAARPLIEQYIASLPSTGERHNRPDGPLGFNFPAEVAKLTVERGREPRSETVLTFFADTKGDEQQEWLAGSAAALLQMRLRDILREDLGGTYGVSAGFSSLMPDPTYATTSVSFGSSPDNAPRLSEEVLTEIKRLATEGPTDDDVVKVREQERRELEVAERQNGYWMSSLQGAVVTGRDPEAIARRIARLDQLTAGALKEAIARYFPLSRYTHATLLPDPAAVSGQEKTGGNPPPQP
ncbi:MAG TPA: insulinase family protein, partial [Vicinamibacterales bacterium]